MQTRIKLLIAALAATLLLAIGTGVAAANRSIELSPGGAIRAVSGAFTLTTRYEAFSIFDLVCATTLGGSLQRSTSKVARSPAGTVSDYRFNFPTCSVRGAATALRGFTVLNLPWTIRYESFSGTLPSVTGILVSLVNFSYLFDVTVIGINSRCLFRADLGFTAPVTSGRISRLDVLEGQRIAPQTLGLNALCPAELRFEARGSFTLEPAQGVRLL